MLGRPRPRPPGPRAVGLYRAGREGPRDRAACGVSAHACHDPCRTPAAAPTRAQMSGPLRHREPSLCALDVARPSRLGTLVPHSLSPSGRATTRCLATALKETPSGGCAPFPVDNRGAASLHGLAVLALARPRHHPGRQVSLPRCLRRPTPADPRATVRQPAP